MTTLRKRGKFQPKIPIGPKLSLRGRIGLKHHKVGGTK